MQRLRKALCSTRGEFDFAVLLLCSADVNLSYLRWQSGIIVAAILIKELKRLNKHLCLKPLALQTAILKLSNIECMQHYKRLGTLRFPIIQTLVTRLNFAIFLQTKLSLLTLHPLKIRIYVLILTYFICLHLSNIEHSPSDNAFDTE